MTKASPEEHAENLQMEGEGVCKIEKREYHSLVPVVVQCV
jgi:hypothetical protein